jgi:hypothetical protein
MTRRSSLTSLPRNLEMGLLLLESGMLELKAIVQADRIKNVAIPRHSNHRFLKEMLERPASPLGYEAPTDI